MTQVLPRHLALAQLKLRSITAGCDDFCTNDVAASITIRTTQTGMVEVFRPAGDTVRRQEFQPDHLIALARMESDHPARAPIRENPPRLSAPPPTDEVRLGTMLQRVRDFMAGQSWVTLEQIQGHLDSINASAELPAISARIRDLRKPMFGGHTVERERVRGKTQLFRYRLELRTRA